jgi:cyclophilin family peptidyl-prolyl cis-trans isomerase
LLKLESGIKKLIYIGKKNTSGSQFFINVADNTFLDYWRPTPSGHPVFGEVISGMDVINNISRVKTNINDAPVTPVKMLRVSSVVPHQIFLSNFLLYVKVTIE